eukprot:TRINITY_DN12767_c0_g1_i1.p1 TRINITY_DN12767_c0_g1~~TRINITY_DN12767_c0_g1_i1.p1  ORF type:complete len:296 (-),score=83.11 TRINITY_DN12767_c0_g1_i1:13-900(-)
MPALQSWLDNIKRLCDAGEAYEAEQLTRSRFTRLSTHGNDALAEKYIFASLDVFSEYGHPELVASIGVFLVGHLARQKASVSSQRVDALLRVASLCGAASSSKAWFLEEALSWCTRSKDVSIKDKIIMIRSELGKTWSDLGRFPEAEEQFIECGRSSVTLLMKTLVQWGRQGHPSEMDMFFARSWLRIVEKYAPNMDFADALLEEAERLALTPSSPLPPDAILLNFVRFATTSIKRKAQPLYEFVLSQYDTRLIHADILDLAIHAGRKAFSIATPSAPSSFSDLLSSVFAGMPQQ